MRSTARIGFLAVILIIDLIFFLLTSFYFPEALNTILRQLPFNDSYERVTIILTGFLIAVITSTAIVSSIMKALRGIGKMEEPRPRRKPPRTLPGLHDTHRGWAALYSM